MTKEVTGFVCDHCAAAGRKKRILASASGCARHEKNCYYNPARRACVSCLLCVNEADETTDQKTIWGRGFGCEDGHDRADAGMCNGAILPAAPKHDCEYWQPKRNDQ